MAGWQLDGFGEVLGIRSFREFWLGFATSALGDTMTRVALTWYVYQTTGSARALGLLALCFTGPILVGGLLAGWLLDRFDRKTVLAGDALIRGAAVFAIPLLAAAGRLELWHAYAVASIYGLLMMISLAGGPTIFPSIVPRRHLMTVNALEILGFTVAGIIGPPLAGVLIGRIGAPDVLLFDAGSYLLFALALARLRFLPEESGGARAGGGLGEAIRLLRGNPILLSTTLMFMFFNLGQGSLFVLLPIFSVRALHSGAGTYGLLLACLSVGELFSSLLAGALVLPLTLGTLICLAQLLSGLALAPLLSGRLAPAAAGLVVYGFCSAPLTIWAQTLRMAIIPERLRGRTFALLRMLMQAGGPVGGLAGGLALPLLGVPLLLLLSGTVVGLPGALGYRVGSLRRADRPHPEVPAPSESLPAV